MVSFKKKLSAYSALGMVSAQPIEDVDKKVLDRNIFNDDVAGLTGKIYQDAPVSFVMALDRSFSWSSCFQS